MWGRGDARVDQGPMATGSLSSSAGFTWGRCCVSCTGWISSCWDFQLCFNWCKTQSPFSLWTQRVILASCLVG